MNTKKLEQWFGLLMVVFAIGFNLWVYRMEPTALTDPNDNTFQFALVERTNQVWDFANKTCSPSSIPGIKAPQFREWAFKPFCILTYLVDHWVPNWAEGYNLPYYYSHLPQIAIVTTYRLFQFTVSLFTYYHWVIYLLLCLFPLSIFFSLRIIRLSPIIAGIGALIASHLSTDGLYGLDPTSFLWRGYGLSSQLFAMLWLPLALAHAWRGKIIPAIVFLAATTAGHLGIGIIAFMSVAVVGIKHIKKLPIIYGGVGLLLGYWILPILKDGSYHNISVWDGIWKFDSFGYREVLTHLINGNLFDFGRFPILTILVFMGLFSSLQSSVCGNSYIVDRKNTSSPHIPYTIPYSPFSFLFIFWLLMYFGRVTWGGLFDLIPGMSEFHLSRFIVGVHIAGIFLIPIGLESIGYWFSYIVDRKNTFSPHIPYTNPHIRFLVVFVSLVVLVSFVFPQTLRYASHNDFLIARANTEYTKNSSDVDSLISHLSSLITTHPGRVFAGRGGSWGKNFRIAETPMYMHLSTYGIPVVLWLPETWSPNSDTEQYFSETNPDHYTLYNVRFVVTPMDLAKDQIQPFWKLIETGEKWKIYEVETDGYITTGVRPAIVSSDKEHFRSVVRLWMHSEYPKQHLYPELTFDPEYPKNTGLPNFRMTDESTYTVPGGSTHSLFAEIPQYVSPIGSPSASPVIITSQGASHDMIFRATINVGNSCTTACMVILKQTFHPSWQATVDGKKVEPFAVFPFFTAVTLDTPGKHDVVFSYEPSTLKQFLLIIALFTLGGLVWLVYKN